MQSIRVQTPPLCISMIRDVKSIEHINQSCRFSNAVSPRRPSQTAPGETRTPGPDGDDARPAASGDSWVGMQPVMENVFL